MENFISGNFELIIYDLQLKGFAQTKIFIYVLKLIQLWIFWVIKSRHPLLLARNPASISLNNNEPHSVMKKVTADNAYAYPLLIKHLLNSCMLTSPHQEIISGDIRRYTYQDFNIRLRKLANALTNLGISYGDTIAVMDWDCHRYLECFFAIPMMGAVLHTVNIRLSPEQILYTINHAQDDIILVHSDFVPVIEQIAEPNRTSNQIHTHV